MNDAWFNWIKMGGYGIYVWSAYFVVLFVLLSRFIWQRHKIKALLKSWGKQ